MTKDHSDVLDAALSVFLRYGYRRTTMGDIAEAAGLSRQSLYARFSNKDEVYAAGLELYAVRTLDRLEQSWRSAPTLSEKLDRLAEIAIYPSFALLTSNPNATDLIEGTETHAGKAAMDRVTKLKVDFFTSALTPYADPLADRGLAPEQLAEFLETSKQSLLKVARDQADLENRFATLKASLLALTD